VNDFAALARLIQAIEPWRAHLVFVGGLAYRLYRFHPLANAPTYSPLMTRDTDLAFANRAPLAGDIRSALAKAGFVEELSGEHRPPVTRYILGDDDAGFYAEFLTPLVGRGVKRSGEPDATVSTAGITAQKLRHLDILLINPWLIRVGPDQDVPLPRPTDLKVASRASFIVQKLLIQRDRTPGSARKTCCTSTMFSSCSAKRSLRSKPCGRKKCGQHSQRRPLAKSLNCPENPFRP
jgi:hypothetical protein